MAGTAKGAGQLDRRREEQALQLFRYVGTFDAVAHRFFRQAGALAAIASLGVVLYAAYVGVGFVMPEVAAGTLTDPSLHGTVSILRDGRDVPHVIAADERDAFYAQGFAEATDRLFQMELTRRYALGTLSEMLGARTLAVDEEQRNYGVRDIAQRQWAALPQRDRADLDAFARGVNAAMRVQPLPVEFRLLLYTPRPWTPQDSLAVALAVSIALGDSWRDVLARDDVWRRYGPRGYEARYPLSDPQYDVSVNGVRFAQRLARVASAVTVRGSESWRIDAGKRPRPGSNAWAAGGERTADGHALLANDPHLELTIPGLWYLVDVRAPGIHVAGAAIPGAPGVALGHNERLAWGATNADVASTSVFDAGAAVGGSWVTERFQVRFAHDVTRRYYRAGAAFGARDPYRNRMVLVRCAHLLGSNPVTTFLALDRAQRMSDALTALARYDGPAENFVLIDTRGNVGYHVAGAVVADPAWGRYVHAAGDFSSRLARIPFAALPAQSPSAGGVVVTANNKMYAASYRYRLAPSFDPPYRAYRISELLGARTFYDAGYFERMQLDEESPVEREFARRVAAIVRGAVPGRANDAEALQTWDGRFSPSSSTATLVHAVRSGVEANAPSLYAALQQLRTGNVSPTLNADLSGWLYYGGGANEPWAKAGAIAVEHPLAPLHFGFLNGATMPGAGDEYTIRLQEPGFSQSFRAVWVAGDWDGGGIAIPSGESGRPGSKHYADLSQAWIMGTMQALPFSNRAVKTAARAQLTLRP